jgi:hypothetical protein
MTRAFGMNHGGVAATSVVLPRCATRHAHA